MTGEARSAMLAAIRSAIGDAASSRSAIEADWESIPRLYRRSSTMSGDALKAHLIERLRDYDANVMESTATGIPHSVETMLRARAVTRILIPSGLPAWMLPPGYTYIPEADCSVAGMNRCDGVITASTLAIAETGTVVLQNAPGQGRRAASLVPDYHLCLVDAERIVATLPEAIAQLGPTAHLPTTFISGPSATADIEMTRIKGVHGPRFLDVLIVSDR